MSAERKRLEALLKFATQLNFIDDMNHWQTKLDELDAKEKENNG